MSSNNKQTSANQTIATTAPTTVARQPLCRVQDLFRVADKLTYVSL